MQNEVNMPSPYRSPARAHTAARTAPGVEPVEAKVKVGGSEALGWAYLAMVSVNVLLILSLVVRFGVAGIAVWFATSSFMLYAVAHHYRFMVDKVRIDADGLTLLHRGGATTLSAATEDVAEVRFLGGQPAALHVRAHRWGVPGLRFEDGEWVKVLRGLDSLREQGPRA